MQKAVKEVNIPFAEIDIRMNTTKSVGSVNNYWFVTSFAGRLSAEEFLSDNLYEIISDRYDKRDEWFTAVTNGEDSEYPFDR